MIFNFFNSKNEVKQRNHNKEQKQSDRNGAAGAYNSVNGNSRTQDPARSSKYPSNDQRKAPTIPNGKRGDLLESTFSGGVMGPAVVQSYNQTMLGMP